MKKVALLLGFYTIVASGQTPLAPWTQTYHLIYSPKDRQENESKSELVTHHTAQNPFSQMVLCWNAQRPEQGHFSFMVAVRDAKSKEWSKWHHISDWGNGLQRSYSSCSDGIAQGCHVRCEAMAGHKADSFAIAVRPEKGAHLKDMHAFFVTTFDRDHFTSEGQQDFSQYPSIVLDRMPTLSQFELPHIRKDSLCSPASCSILLTYLLQQPIDPLYFAERSYDKGLNSYGSWPFNMATAYELGNHHYFFATTRLHSFKRLLDYLHAGTPVVVSIRGCLKGAPRKYKHGHIMVIVGYDKDHKQVLCHDPAGMTVDATIKRYDVKDFVKAWERSNRLSYIAYKAVNLEREK